MAVTSASLEDHAAQAINASRALRALVLNWDFGGHQLRLRIDMATGLVAAGTVGGATSQTYTVYCDTVNLAQRLERLNMELGTANLILLTERIGLDEHRQVRGSQILPAELHSRTRCKCKWAKLPP